MPQNINWAIDRRYLHFRWRRSWGNQQHFSRNLKMESDSPKMCPKIWKPKLQEMVGGRSEQFWGVFGSPEGRWGLVLAFPRPFLATLVFGFLGTFLKNPTPSSDFSWNAADCINFAAIGNADGDDLSLNLHSEALSEVRRYVRDLFWSSYNHFAQLWFSGFRAHFWSF